MLRVPPPQQPTHADDSITLAMPSPKIPDGDHFRGRARGLLIIRKPEMLTTRPASGRRTGRSRTWLRN